MIIQTHQTHQTHQIHVTVFLMSLLYVDYYVCQLASGCQLLIQAGMSLAGIGLAMP
jgi:hypothetical protein